MHGASTSRRTANRTAFQKADGGRSSPPARGSVAGTATAARCRKVGVRVQLTQPLRQSRSAESPSPGRRREIADREIPPLRWRTGQPEGASLEGASGNPLRDFGGTFLTPGQSIGEDRPCHGGRRKGHICRRKQPPRIASGRLFRPLDVLCGGGRDDAQDGNARGRRSHGGFEYGEDCLRGGGQRT